MALRNLVALCMLALRPYLLNGMPEITPELRVLNGIRATSGDYPFMVAIFYNGTFGCSGTILSKYWILTANHCLSEKTTLPKITAAQITVLPGTIDARDTDAPRFSVSRIIEHEAVANKDFDKQIPHDIGLIKLKTPLPDTISWEPVQLATPAFDPKVGDDAREVGFGRTLSKIRGGKGLYWTNVQVISNRECAQRHGISSAKFRICAWSRGTGSGQCKGDSGGPLLVRGGANRFYQVGVISFTSNPCGAGPGVSVRVSKYISWIKKKTGGDIITT